MVAGKRHATRTRTCIVQFLPFVLGMHIPLPYRGNRNVQSRVFINPVHCNANRPYIAMKRQWIGTYFVEVYDSIEEIPIVRWHKYQKYALIESGIGSDLSALDGHMQRVSAFIKKGDTDSAVKEIENLRQSVFFIQQGANPKLMSAVCLIKSIDGKPNDDLTEEGIKRTIDKLSNVPNGVIAALYKVVKKKMETEMAVYFGTGQASSNEKEFSDILRKRTLAILKRIITEYDNESEIYDLTLQLLTKNKPADFSNGKFEKEYDLQFERLCLLLARAANIRPKECSVIEFYNAYNTIKAEAKKNGRRK